MRYIALLRGINVGGTGLLAMKDLARLCEGLRFGSVRTYIQTGNVVLESPLTEAAVKAQLERALEQRMGKAVSVMVRTAEELRRVCEENPFPGKEGSKIGVSFLDSLPPADLASQVNAPGGELIHPGRREVYVYYPNGMGDSKLKLPLKGASATVRNMNTVGKLADLAEK